MPLPLPQSMRKAAQPVRKAPSRRLHTCSCCKVEIDLGKDIEGICTTCAAGECLACVDARTQDFLEDDEDLFFPDADENAPEEDS